MKMRKILSAIISVCLTISMIAGCRVVDNTYVAEVNGEKITRAEYIFFLAQMQGNMLQQAGVTEPEEYENFWKTTEIDGKKALDVAKSQALEDAIEIRVICQKAKELGIELNDDKKADIEDHIANEISQYNSSEAFYASLEKMGTTFDAYKNWITSIYVANSVATEFLADDSIIASDEEVFESIKSTYIKAKHILLLTTDKNTGEPLTGVALNAVKEKANSLLKRIKAGEDFDKLMMDNTEDPGIMTEPDGYIFGKGEMVPEFETAAYALKEGEVSDIVTTSYGFHIIKREHLELTQSKIDEYFISEQNKLTENTIQEKFTKWIEESDVKIQEKVVAKMKAF